MGKERRKKITEKRIRKERKRKEKKGKKGKEKEEASYHRRQKRLNYDGITRRLLLL